MCILHGCACKTTAENDQSHITTMMLHCFKLTSCLLLLLFVSSSSASSEGQCETNENGQCIDCKDFDDNCKQWASVGKCSVEVEEKADFYQKTCPKSCRECWSCDDESDSCKTWADAGECNANPRYMMVYCVKSCNVCHYKGDLTELIQNRLEEKATEDKAKRDLDKTKYGAEQILTDDKSKATYDEMVEYIEKTVMVEPKYAKIRGDCKLRSENCVFWAATGHCEETRDYMITQCAPACKSCEMLDFDLRCPYDADAETALNPGDLNKVFEKLITLKQYAPNILSMPNSTSPEIFDGPWVVTLDDFLTPEECDRLIVLGSGEGYQESADVGTKKWDGSYDRKVNTGRTSTNAWCQNDCLADPITQAVTDRMEEITNIPSANFEFLQLLQYEIGQFYQQHHDFIDYHNQRKQGARTLTIFLYLNDVEAGGGTNFPLLNNMTILPKRGKALIWPSVLDEDPNTKDPRTDHQALPVEKGVKYGANAWVHQRDFKEPFARACI